jgi:hypothetical protein
MNYKLLSIKNVKLENIPEDPRHSYTSVLATGGTLVKYNNSAHVPASYITS